MQKLTDAQVVDIQRFLAEKLDKSSALTDELLDHICILTELEMQSGKPFDKALSSAFLQLDQTVLQEIRTSEQMLSWTNHRVLTGLRGVILLLIGLGFVLFFARLRGFRLAWLLSLLLTAYGLLPILALKNWSLSPQKRTKLLLLCLGFVQINSLIFVVVRLRLLVVVLPILLITSLVGGYIFLQNRKAKNQIEN